jgi:hypothetical protein
MSNIASTIPTIAVSVENCTVTIEMICADPYAARVVYDDVLSKVTSDAGVVLRFRGRVQTEPGKVE